MKNRLPLYLILAIVLVPTVFQLSRWLATAKPKLLALDLSGLEGVLVQGYYLTDGASNYINSPLPLRFTFRTRELACEFSKEADAGALTLQISGMGPQPAIVTGGHGVRAAIKISTFGRSITVNGF